MDSTNFPFPFFFFCNSGVAELLRSAEGTGVTLLIKYNILES